MIWRTPENDLWSAQLALKVQYAPMPAIPMKRIVGSSKAARWPGEAIHIAGTFANEPIAEF